MQSHQTSPFNQPAQPFTGIRFVLLGFDPISKSQVSRKLVDNGGVDSRQYDSNCTHVIVDKLTYDDPVCVRARRDGKKLVSSLWVEHSFDVGAPVKTTDIMYRPLKDLNGIPSAKSLVICLTGYQRVDREDIMTMVSLMGAQFSKALVANKITHLICYKFEGEKYLLAKKINRIKIVNHKWLEDCLKAWDVVLEDDYSKSGYELEMEAEAQDSEDEAEGVTMQNERKIASPHQSLLSKQEISRNLLNSASKTTSDLFPNSHEISNTENVIGATYDPSIPHDGTTNGSTAVNRNIYAATSANKSSLNEEKKGASPTVHTTTSNTSSAKRLNKQNFIEAFNASSSLVDKFNEEQNCSSYGKRKIDSTNSSFKQQRMNQNEEASNRRSPHVESAFEELNNGPPVETSNHVSDEINFTSLNDKTATSPPKLSPSNVTTWNTSNSRGKNVNVPISKTPTLHGESSSGTGSDLMKSSTGAESNLGAGSNSKPVKRKSFGKRFSAASQNLDKTKTVNQKGSIHLKNNETNDATTSMADIDGPSDNEDLITCQKYEKAYLVDKSENMFGNKSSCMDDETEPPEDQEEANKENPVDIVMAEKAEGYVHDVDQDNDEDYDINLCRNLNTFKSKVSLDKSVDTHILVSDQASNGKKKGRKSTVFSENEATVKKIDKRKELASESNERPEIRVEINNGEPEDTVDIVMEEKTEQDQPVIDQDNDIVDDVTECRSVITVQNRGTTEITDVFENPVSNKTSRVKKICKRVAKRKELAGNNDDVNDLEYSMNLKGSEDACNDPELKNEKEDDKEKKGTKKSKRVVNKAKEDASQSVKEVTVKNKKVESHNTNEKAEIGEKVTAKTMKNVNGIENVVKTKATKTNKRASKAKKDVALNVKEVANAKVVTKGKRTSSGCSVEAQKENVDILADQSTGKKQVVEKITHKPGKANSDSYIVKDEPKWFILTGHKLQRREYQQMIRKLKGRVCRVSHQWSYQATHFIVPDPIRRTEKFFAAAASGRWILKTDYLTASNQAGRFLDEEAYEWHKNCLSQDGQINLEAPRKWRLLKEKTGHGAFYGMRIVIYGECIAPPLDTIKRAVKAGDGTILATSPPYTRFLNTNIDFAVVSPGMPHVDAWVQEFLKHEIPCISADYLVEYVCKPGYSLDKHILYNTNVWAERSYNNLQNYLKEDTTEPRTPESDDVACEVCGSRDRGEEMLICGDESGSIGCGVGTHFDCCDPPLDDVPDEDWFCPKCIKAKEIKTSKRSSKRKGK
ncbi:BRCT domain-containing protein At4g02110 [Rutidosis leptorrhynchoides]|uniref:BRCT domain-containing protein At4g02110 n=1 Tax=Rutidosis leptorrhynchoides TaxID=125765 RepID=UPI003A998831